MDTSSCVMGIERFVARRGVPGVIWSHNGANFIATERELLNNVLNWNQQTLTDSLVKKIIKWNFNPPSAPHHGGVWERFVSSFIHTFYAILGNRKLTDEIFFTTFCIVEQSPNAPCFCECRGNRVRCSHSKQLPAGKSWLEPTIVGKL